MVDPQPRLGIYHRWSKASGERRPNWARMPAKKRPDGLGVGTNVGTLALKKQDSKESVGRTDDENTTSDRRIIFQR